MSEILQLSHLQEGFKPSRECLKEIASTRKPNFPMKLGNVNYYGWYSTSEIRRDSFMFITALILESLVLMVLFFYAFKNGSISEREIIVLICTVLFIPLDLISLRMISENFFNINKHRQLIEILSGIGQDQIQRAKSNEFIINAKKTYYRKAWLLYVSFLLKIIGIFLTVAIPKLPQLFLFTIAVLVLILHYNYSPYYYKFFSARKLYYKEYNSSNHKEKLPEISNNVIEENLEYQDGKFNEPPVIIPNFGFDYIIFSLKFDEKYAKIIPFNSFLILDNNVINSVNVQSSNINKDIIAKLLIKHQTNI